MLYGAAAAITSLSDARRRALRDASTPRNAQALDRYLHMGPVIETRWMVLRVIGISGSSLLWFMELRNRLDFNVSTIIALAGTLFAFGVPAEIARAIFAGSAEKMAPILLRLLRPLEWLVLPLATPLAALNRAAQRTLPVEHPHQADIVENEMGIFVDEREKSGEIAHDEAELIKNVLDFGDLTVGEIMVPRTQVDALEIGTPIQEVLERVCHDGHSRYPVYAERIDNVLGVLHVKDVISTVDRWTFPTQLVLEPLVRRPALYVSDGQTATSVLHEMRLKRQHLAIVVDEFGGMRGIVTLEDIVERIVGDIRDEHDEEALTIAPLLGGRFLVDAAVSILDVNRCLETDLPIDDAYNSLGGLLVARMGRVPPVGARLNEYGLEFVIRQADERHISQVEIAKVSRSTAPASSSPRVVTAD
jgi:putative hemolysin